MLDLFFSIFLAVTIIVCFIRLKWGIAMFLMYSILVPYLSFFSYSFNLFSGLIIIALLKNYKITSLIYKPLSPFLFLYIAQLFIIPFHDDVPYAMQLDMFRSDFMRTIILPFVMMNIMFKNTSAISLFSKVLVITIIIAVCYSLFLTTTGGLNPYLMSILPLNGGEFNSRYAAAEDGGRLFGRISGVFNHPMTNGIFLCLSFLFVFFNISYKKISKHKFLILLLLITFIAVFIIGVRTAIVALFVGFFIFLLLEKKFKITLIGFFSIAILLLILYQIPGTDVYVSSILDPQSSDVSGSSLDMRYEQLAGCFHEIRNNPVFGKGLGWTYYYSSTKGLHPTMLAFESLLIVVLCNNGFIGLIIWFLAIYFYVKLINNSFSKTPRNIMIALFMTYIAYSLVTGDYGYMKYLLIFYVIVWAKEKENLHKINH